MSINGTPTDTTVDMKATIAVGNPIATTVAGTITGIIVAMSGTHTTAVVIATITPITAGVTVTAVVGGVGAGAVVRATVRGADVQPGIVPEGALAIAQGVVLGIARAGVTSIAAGLGTALGGPTAG